MRRQILGRALAALALQCLLIATPTPALARDDDPLLSDWEIVAATGKSITEHGNDWWAFAFEHPDFLFDTTGEFSALGDVKGPVFYVTGSGGEPVDLKVDVPRGQLLLLPIATYIWTFFDPCAEIRCARKIINDNVLSGIRKVYLKIDGKRVRDLDSQLVTVSRRNPQVFLVDAGPIPPEGGYGGILPALQGGYWAMLKPLSPGRHVLEFGATVPEVDGETGAPTGDTIQLTARLTVTVAGCRKGRRCND